MKTTVSRMSDPTTMGERLNIDIVMERHLGEYVDGQMIKDIASDLTKYLVEELKPEVSKAIKDNIQQIVKDVGADITIAGLKYLLGKESKDTEGKK